MKHKKPTPKPRPRPPSDTDEDSQEIQIVDEAWFKNVWRPAMAWTYMAICLFDFIIAPTGVAILITVYKSTIPVWRSLTLEAGGLVHVAFGAILGITAWGRTREKQMVMSSVGGGGYGNQMYPSTYINQYPQNPGYNGQQPIIVQPQPQVVATESSFEMGSTDPNFKPLRNLRKP